jgi:tripartite-type tricarboxylate transporter receptor subunit TctC
MARWLSAAIAAFALLSAPAFGQDSAWPAKAVHIVVPFPAGGIVDSVARSIGEKLSAKYGQPVVVENRPGAGGSIGTEVVAKAAPDGYTMLMVGTGFTVLPQIMKDIRWHPSDFEAVLLIGSVPNVIVVNPTVPAHDMKELIALAKQRGATPLTYGSPGIGSSPHLSGEMLAQMAGVKLTHVPYKGQPDAVTDLLGGRIDMMALTAALAIPHVKAGKLRALAVTAPTRIHAMPELPTVAEAAGLPKYDVRPWTGVFVPAKTPPAIAKKIADDMMEALAMPDVKSRMDHLGMELAPQPTKEFDAFLVEETQRWSDVLHKAGLAVK